MSTRNIRGRKIGGRSLSPVIGSCQQRLTRNAKREAVRARQESYLAAVARWEADAWARLHQEVAH